MIEAIPDKIVGLDLDKATAWLEAHWKEDKDCQVCGNDQWHIVDKVVEVRAYGEGQLNHNGPLYPLMSVLCTTCGNTLFFNARFAGLVVQPE